MVAYSAVTLTNLLKEQIRNNAHFTFAWRYCIIKLAISSSPLVLAAVNMTYIYLKILNALSKHKGKFRDLANALANFRRASDVYRGSNHSASGDILIRSFYRVG